MHGGSRLLGRVEVVGRAALARAGGPRVRPESPQRILVAHHLLLGDTLMLTPLLAKLRARWPAADIAMTVPTSVAPLYGGRPFGVRVLPWDPRALDRTLFDEPAFDLAIVPGDNRFAWLAAALRARWIVAFAGDRPWSKSLAIDEQLPYPGTPGAWGDMVAQLVSGPAPASYRAADWPAPACAPFARPASPYAVLHVGASSPLKQWLPERWSALADALVARGLTPVWSAGPGEVAAIDAADPAQRFARFAGTLSLAQLWHLVADAALLVAPDTGIAHMGRLTWTPTVTLFGPGSAVICGPGDFWRDAPYRAVTVEAFPCRDQHVLFRREIAWVQRCGRTLGQCSRPRCMEAIALAPVLDAVDALRGGR